VLYLAYYIEYDIAEIEMLWLSCIEIWGTFFASILRIFCNGWMDCRDAFHAVLCLYCCVMDKT